MQPPPWAQLVEYADRHLGIFTTADARRFGVSKRMLQYGVEHRAIERVHRRVFRVVGARENWHQRVLAAVRRGGPRARASGRSAAALHRFDGYGEGPLDVVVPRTPFAAIDRCTVGCIPATSPARTILDLGRVVDEAALVRALDSAERDGKVERHLLLARLADERHRPGIARLARVSERREAVGHTPRSVLERAFLDLLAAHGLPAPFCQYEVTRRDGRTAYLDFAYPDLRLAIEVDGNGSHATPARRGADNDRSNQLPLWRFVRFTYEDVTGRAESLAATVALHLTS